MTMYIAVLLSALIFLMPVFPRVAGAADDTKPLDSSVLVLPFQASRSIPADKAALGLTVQNVLENMLALHSGLDECWFLWHMKDIFPDEKDFQTWFRGREKLPEDVKRAGIRYLVTGKVSLHGDDILVDLELLDYGTGKKSDAALAVDLPGLVTFRQGFLDLLDRAGIPVPEAQRAKMLWREELTAQQFILLGNMLYEYFPTITWPRHEPGEHPKPLDRPDSSLHSYLLLNILGWIEYEREHYPEAIGLFEQALAFNGSGADAAVGMGACARKLNNEDMEETWAGKTAQIKGRDPKVALGGVCNRQGNAAYEKGDYAAAIEHYQKAVELQPENVVYVTNLAGAYRQAEHFEDGEKLLEDARKKFGAREDQNDLRVALADLHFFWAKSLEQKAAYTDAISHYRKAIELNPEKVDYTTYAAIAYARAEKFEEGQKFLEDAKNRFPASGDQDELRIAFAGLHFVWAESLNKKTDYADAVLHYKKSVELDPGDQLKVAAAFAINKIGYVYSGREQFDIAVDYYEQALKILRDLKNRQGECIVLNYLGSVYGLLKDYSWAISFDGQALTAARAAQDRLCEGTSLNSLGVHYQADHRYDNARESYEQALAIARDLQNLSSQANILDELGTLYDDFDQYDKAIECYEQALQIARTAQDGSQEARTLNHLGKSYSSLNRLDKAGENYQQALLIARRLQDRAQEEISLTGLGAVAYAQKDSEQIVSFFQQMLTSARERKNRANEATGLNGLGAAYYSLKNYERSIEYFEKALALSRELHEEFNEAYAIKGLGIATYFLGRYEQAAGYLEQGLALLRQMHGRLPDIGSTFTSLMFAYNALHKPRLAIFYGKLSVNIWQEIRGKLTKESQGFFLKSKEDTYRKLADLLIVEERLSEAQQVLDLLKQEEYFEFVRRDAKEADSLQGRANLTPDEASWEKRYSEIGDRVTALGAERGSLLVKTSRTADEEQRLAKLDEDLTVARKAFEKFLDVLSNELGNSQKARETEFQLRETQGLMEDLRDLGPGVVAMYTLVSEKKYRVILITPDTETAGEYPIDAADLDRMVLDFRQILRNQFDPVPMAQELYRILIGPVEQKLRNARADTIMWSLDGLLRYLPVSALHDGDKYLVENYRNVIFTPASQARLKDRPSSRWKGLGLGVTKAHEGFPPLTSVEDELSGIIREEGGTNTGGVLPGTIKLDTAFTAESMLTALRQRYPVVHIASHFSFQPGNETSSFLLLGDGSHLSLAQIKTLPNVFSGVELLTLSACDTAAGSTGGDGKEVEGFGVLAQRQGAKAVVATLWPVADESTKQLMQRFYRLREDRRLSKIEALRQAQLSLLYGRESADDQSRSTSSARLPYAHPYFWAPFILIGNWQ